MTADVLDCVSHTAAGVPVLVFDYAPGAPLYLVTVRYCAELRRAWVVGSPRRLVDFAGGVLRQQVSAERRDAIDETLLAVEGTATG